MPPFRSRPFLGLRDVVLLTAPVLFVVGYLVAAAASDYHRAIQFDDYWTGSLSVEKQFLARATGFLRIFPAMRQRRRIDTEKDDAGMVRLQLDPGLLDGAYRDPQLGWGKWLKATLVDGDRLLPSDVRKRGDNSVHWLTEKKTLTVRTSRAELYKQYRSFGLSAKEVLTAYVANRLAREFNLLAPATTVVPVVLNNQYAGMFRFVEVADESFLRTVDRMPGNIFRGDAAERSEYFKGIPRDLFANPYLWDRVARNDKPTAPDSGQLRLFLEDVNGNDFAAQLRLMSRLDREEVSRLVAFLLLAGDPYHMDGVHNQLWYEDPSTALLHPLPWDVRLLRLEQRPSTQLNGFLRAVLRDPWVVDGVLAELHRRLASGAWLALGDSLASAAWSRYHAEFAYDSLREQLIPPLGSPAEVRQILKANARVLGTWLADAGLGFAATPAAGGVTVLDFETRGFAGIDLAGLAVSGPAVAGRPALRMDRNLNGVLDPDDPVVAGVWHGSAPRHFVPAAPLGLLAAWRTGLPYRDGQPGLAPGTQHYRFFLTGVGSPVTLRPILVNRYTREPVEPRPWQPGSLIAPAVSFSPWQYPVARGRLYRLAGSVHLRADLRLSASDTLVIAPGTTLKLDPDVSIVSRGRVTAVGTAARPILVTRADANRPWGAFALQGTGADSSRFSFVTFEWGGGALLDRIEYSGMVNLHRTRGVLLDHSVLRDNLRSDDTFHALHADFTLQDSHFLRANSDAIDLDISTGLIANDTIEQTGGDAIDLMTSAPVIRDNLIRGSNDKGISVGEASNPFIYHNRIENCRRGIEVKDRSEPIVLHNLLAHNGAGIYEDRKNWRYGGGGWATVINTTLGDNTDSLRLDSFSHITVSTDSLVGSFRLAGLEPLASERFEEDFASTADGWKGAGGVTRVEKIGRALHAAVERRPGVIGKTVSWDLRGRATPATLVLDVATHSLDSGEVRVLSPDGEIRRRLALSDDPAIFRQVTLQLPPRRYTAIVITLSPRPRIEKLVRSPGWTDLRPGQFWLQGYDLYGAGSVAIGPARRPAS
jgi:parallel beta-helix repeat protein